MTCVNLVSWLVSEAQLGASNIARANSTTTTSGRVGSGRIVIFSNIAGVDHIARTYCRSKSWNTVNI